MVRLADAREHHPIDLTLDVAGLTDMRLPGEVETTVFRIVQEALANAVKHSGARNASVVVARRGGEVTLAVADDGCGFRPGGVDLAGHLGLTGMRERAVGNATSFAGQYNIASHADTAEELGGFARSHWQIANGLRWVLDVAFREDESRTRDAKAGANVALLRRIAVSLVPHPVNGLS